MGPERIHSSFLCLSSQPCISSATRLAGYVQRTKKTLESTLGFTGADSSQWCEETAARDARQGWAVRAGHPETHQTARPDTGLGVVEESPLTCRQRVSSPLAWATPSPRLRLPRLSLRLPSPPRHLLPEPSLLLLPLLLLSLKTADGRDRDAAGPSVRGDGCMLAAGARGDSTTLPLTNVAAD